MKPVHAYEIPSGVAAVLAVSVIASDFYQVRELLAALLMFTVLFAMVAMVFVMVFLLQRAAVKGMTHFEGGMARVHAGQRHTIASARQSHDHALRNSRWS